MSIRQGTPLAAEDAARLHMSVSANPMLITALMLLDRSIGHEELEARLEARLAGHPRFREVVVEPRLRLGMPRWVADPTFDVRNHVHRIDASLLPGTPTLDALVSDLASIPLSNRRPLWRVHVIEGRFPAIVMVVHHVLADGSALLSLLAELVDEGTTADAVEPAAMTAGRSLRTRAWQVALGAFAAGRLAAMSADPRTPLRGTLGPRKDLAFSAPMDLEKMRTTAHDLGTTVTGILLAAVAGACRTELGSKLPKQGLVLHALVPVDLPRASSSSRRSLGNQYGSAFVALSVGTDDLATRIRSARDAAQGLRSRAAGIAGARLATAAGGVASVVERLGVAYFSRKASVVVSSVRGPTTELHLCGASVRDIVVWAPAPGSIALGITLMSYAGHVRIGVAADVRVVGDAGRIVGELEREIAAVHSFASSAGA